MKLISYKIFLLTIGLLISCNSFSQIITTVAGNGTQGYSGDGGMAISVMLSSAPGVATDASGNLYIADYGNNCIRKVNASGIITTIVGNGTAGYSGDGGLATAAKLNSPTGIAVDGSGNLFIADEYNNVIRKVNTSGIITTVAGNNIPGYSGDGGAATAAKLNSPIKVKVDGFGNLFIADLANDRIRKVNTSGIITTVAGNGTPGFSGDGSAASAAGIDGPIDIVIDTASNLFIVDANNNRIRKVNASGIITTIAGSTTGGYSGDGSLATAAELNGPTGITIDGSGNLFISDGGNNRVRKINTAGIITTIAGNGVPGYSGDGGQATLAEIQGPTGITIDVSGDLFIAEDLDNVVRKVHVGNAGISGITSLNNITVLPDPNNGIFTIKGKLASLSDETVTLEVTNVLGQPVYKNTIEAQQGNIKRQIFLDNNIPNGIYLLYIRSVSTNDVLRFVIEK